MFETSSTLEYLSFLAGRVSPMWLFQLNTQRVCPSLASKQSGPSLKLVTHTTPGCQTPFCLTKRYLDTLMQSLEHASLRPTLSIEEWDMCISWVADFFTAPRK